MGKRRCSSPSHRQKRERIKDERERIDRQKALRYGSFSGRRTRVTVDDASSQDSGPGSHADPTKERDYCKAGRVLFSPLRSCLRSVVGGNWPGYPLHFHAWALPPSLPQSPSLFPSTVGGGREGSDRPPASRGERPTPILALSHPSVLTLRRQAIRPVLNRSWVVAQFPTHSLRARGRARA